MRLLSTHLRAYRFVACGLLGALSSAMAAEHAPRTLEFPQATPLPVSVTLLPRQGQVGRDTPFYNGYRPQLRFAGMKDGVTCAIKLPPPRDKLEPGETADLTATCLASLRLREDQLDFSLYEGGRQVGRGTLKAPD